MSLSFRSARWLRTTNLLLQALLVLTLVSGLNYLALNHGWRFDLTQNRRHSLSPETRAYLKALSAPVKIVVTLTPDSENKEVVQAWRDVSHLLRDYAEVAAGGDNPITVEYIDVYKQRRDAEAYGIDQPNVILITSGGRPRVVTLNDLYELKEMEKKAFKGEQILTAAILNVTSASKDRIYFLEGHGEMRLDDVDPARGLSLLRDELVARNYALHLLDLSARDIPDDAALLIIAGTQGRYSPAEQETLRRYLNNRAGRILVLLAPGYPHGLDTLFFDWGILADDVLIIDPSAAGQSDTGDLILRATTAEHPITRVLSDNHIALRFGPSRQVRPDPGRTLDPALNSIPLLATSAAAWGERNYRNLNAALRYDEGIDLRGPLAVGTAAERTTGRSNLPFSIRGGRVVAYGGADWIANGRLAAGGNLSLVLSSINWLIDRDTQVNIQPRPIQRYQLTLSQAQIARLRYSLVFGLPALIGFIGLIVYWTRRR